MVAPGGLTVQTGRPAVSDPGLNASVGTSTPVKPRSSVVLPRSPSSVGTKQGRKDAAAAARGAAARQDAHTPPPEALCDGPADANRGGDLLDWVHLGAGCRLAFPLQWGIAHRGDFAAELHGCQPRVVLRDSCGTSVDVLRKAQPVVEEPAAAADDASRAGSVMITREAGDAPEVARRFIAVYIDDYPDPSQQGKDWESHRSSLVPPKRGADAQAAYDAELRKLCKQVLKLTLHQEHLHDIDGVTDVRQIRVGDKCNRGLYIGGFRAFGFAYTLYHKRDRTNAGYRYLVGSFDPRRHVRTTFIICTDDEALQTALPRYAQEVLCAHLGSQQNFQLFRPPATADEPAPGDIVSELGRGDQMRQEHGYVRYCNAGAALSLSVVAHPQQWQRGVSLTRARSAAHILRLIVRMRVHPTAQDTAALAMDDLDDELAGIAVQPVDVSLGVDVEDIVRARHPGLMSAAQYASLKMKPVMLEFQNTKPNGAPLANTIGGRSGMSFLWTGNVSGESRMTNYQKAMCSATICNNKGVVASFFTKMGQGIFDTNLYIMQDLLKYMCFIPEREADGPFDTARATKERLCSADDFKEAFAGKEGGGTHLVARYTFLASCFADGGVAGRWGPQAGGHPKVIQIEPEGEGGEEERRGRRRQAKARPAAADQDTNSAVDVSDIPHIQKAAEEETQQREYWAKVNESLGEDGAQQYDHPLEREGMEGGPPAPPALPPDEPPAAEQSPQAASGAESAAASPEAVPDSPQPTARSAQSPPEGAAEEEAAPSEPQRSPRAEAAPALTVEEREMVGTGLRHMYLMICERHGVRPNSRFLSKLPTDGAVTATIESLELSWNYFGKGFAAALELLLHMPRVLSVELDDMSLTNEDVRAMCAVAAQHPRLQRISLRDNPKVSLASGKALLGLVRSCPRIEVIDLDGTSIGEEVIDRIQAEIDAHAEARYSPEATAP
eukprot:TRINITY_DN65404_c0_g1_i1.p1 TRINITY_DN65404_c0_g1~~TRINITY_DN65404_c0_g1_i1.p1  ORF type:complete len:979 (+),score=338.18 TRINITY_DN65404_c0_g1_i1:82-2937(+)